jgi:4Fe-4S ferredoxin
LRAKKRKNQKSLSILVNYSFLVDFLIDLKLVRDKKMAFALHVNMERCTGCNNCVVACPVDALELYTLDPVTKEKIYKVKHGKATVLDFKQELCAGCGVCVEACPHDVIRLAGRGSVPSKAKV